MYMAITNAKGMLISTVKPVTLRVPDNSDSIPNSGFE